MNMKLHECIIIGSKNHGKVVNRPSLCVFGSLLDWRGIYELSYIYRHYNKSIYMPCWVHNFSMWNRH